MEHELFNVVRSGRLKEFKKIKERLATDQNASNLLLTALSPGSKKNTILHEAAELGHQGLVECILKTQSLSSLLRATNMTENTPMHCAALAGHARVVSSLLKHSQTGDQENGYTSTLQHLLRARNIFGSTPLHLAAEGGHKQVIEILIKALDPTLLLEDLMEVNTSKETPLSLAICKNKSSIVEAILKAKPDIPFDLRGPQNHTLLHSTVLQRDLASMKAILQNRAELAKEGDSMGRTPLHYAAALGHHSLVRVLLKRDASTAYLPDFTQALPVHLAVENNDKTDALRELYKSSPYLAQATDGAGRTILHRAAQKGNENIVKYLMRLPETMIDSVDEDGNTALHLAAKNSHYRIVHIFSRDPRVRVCETNKDGQKALDIMSIVHNQTTLSQHEDQSTTHLQKENLKKAEETLRFRVVKETESLDEFLKVQALDHPLGRKRSVDQKQKDLAKVVMLAATLVATVAFAVVFQPPGGYVSDGPNKGFPVLSTTKNGYFSWLVKMDYFAMNFSMEATLCILLAFWCDEHFEALLTAAIFLTYCAFIFLAGVFATGLSLL